MFDKIKNVGRCILALYGFFYDWIRYIKYNGWKKNLSDKNFRNYYISKVYHTLEKSMSYKERRKGAAYSNALLLLDTLSYVDVNDPGFHDLIAVEVLRKFCQLEGNSDDIRFIEIEKKIPLLKSSKFESGARNLSLEELYAGKLEDPEAFFNSRFSLREYSTEPVAEKVIFRALELAQKTPSSCNMQGWHTYLISDPSKLTKSLDIQSGNRGFGHKVKGLLILACDQTPFISSSERYQHWIDGGLYSMSVVYAFHSLGVSSCCLNWSEDPKRDILLRRELGIKDEHSIMMMLSFGYPEKENKVCVSPRRPLNESVTVI
ncbi:nitroreductase family protein [Photobacterium lutimaris]|uniref:Nitroreductase n=1 Tax=Photobacterium lutimaris TaxID=388278 RepID=A0A2T3INC8_9GAMM|nr:nitroreductase family protein [Photobacterium lutimaris]PSU29835.1 nitroreductase [Photobacterium lutimaris]TDR75260.1 nitroreductase [Photobacterium lutimaris]